MAKIVVAYDGSESGKRALARAAEHGKAGDEVTVVSVAVPLPASPYTVTPVVPDDGVSATRRALDEAVAALLEQGVECGKVEAIGDPGVEICETAAREHADLVIVGSRNLGGLRRALLGSVSDRVAHMAGCDVLIVK